MDFRSALIYISNRREEARAAHSRKLAILMTNRDWGCFIQLCPKDFLSYSRRVYEMDSRWIRLAEDVTACAIAGLSEPISGVAQELQHLRNYFSFTAMLQGLQKAGCFPENLSTFRGFIEPDKNYQLCRAAHLKNPGLPFLHPHVHELRLQMAMESRQGIETGKILQELFQFVAYRRWTDYHSVDESLPDWSPLVTWNAFTLLVSFLSTPWRWASNTIWLERAPLPDIERSAGIPTRPMSSRGDDEEMGVSSIYRQNGSQLPEQFSQNLLEEPLDDEIMSQYSTDGTALLELGFDETRYTFILLSNLEHSEIVKVVLPDTLQNVIQLLHVPYAQELPDESWEMVSQTSNLTSVLDKLRETFPTSCINPHYDPYIPTEDEILKHGLDVARTLRYVCFQGRLADAGAAGSLA
ncbi:hypothetical protein VC83_07598 [Pseudogymnoascus destructans]|uniref:Uncharacterized protein n=2 Tax=Pseudogymnoascus destructans TaxID=655981 RepID=L8G7R9_PSED2|nr:uncharacterized protein VC83_07598 [Pseudogymnoascus destructans]ELR09117.1 hypothetical protein GMDG_03697 [Pseudogymnoascus destructans 20631-21]OAF55526.1 hypothetical protein VC83_07598 [Pseudogymnoascus destructans]